MRLFRLTATPLFVIALASFPVFAQQRQGTTPPVASPSPAQSGSAATIPAKIAFINTEIFKDEKVGIMRWIDAAKRLQREFDPLEKELETLETRIQTITRDLDTLSKSTVVDRNSIIAKQDDLARLQREQKFKKEDGEARFKKRYAEVIGPVSQDIGKALDVFAKQRGITLLLEYTTMMGAILSADKSTDMTVAFITEYNSKNPVVASPAAPGR